MIQSLCFAGIIVDPSKVILSALSLSFAIATIFLLKRFSFSNKAKIGLLYGHLVFLFYPLILFTTHTTCGMLCVSSCYNAANSFLNLMLLSLPTTLLVSTIASFVVIPLFYVKTNSERQIKRGWIISFVKKSSKALSIKTPRIFAIDKANPQAFSFKHFSSAIFLSVGLFDILNRKELEAVILHELAHIKEKTSALNLSLAFFRILSPMSMLVKFHHEKTEEEKKADKLAANIQKTNRHIKSARAKIRKYENKK